MQTSSIAIFTAVGLLVGGALVSIQAPTNALLSKAVGSPVNGALISFFVGAAALGALAVIHHTAPNGAAVRALPWYAWLGGLYGAFFVVVAAFAAPRIGVGPTVALAVAGQAIASLLIDEFGAFDLPRHPITLTKALGMVAVVIGVLLVRRQ